MTDFRFSGEANNLTPNVPLSKQLARTEIHPPTLFSNARFSYNSRFESRFSLLASKPRSHCGSWDVAQPRVQHHTGNEVTSAAGDFFALVGFYYDF